MPSILVDAGPLIALVNPVDKHHKPVKAYLRRFKGRLLTTWPVLAEVCHFMSEQMQIGFLRWADGGGIGVLDILTIDRKDFSVYRMPNGKSLNLVL